MGFIYCIMGKSASGKDTIYQKLLQDASLGLKTVVPYTTRPIRDGETAGKTYHFCTEEEVDRLEAAGKIIELRSYDTVYGIWKYFTADDGQIDLDRADYAMIGTLESYLQIRAYFGPDRVIPIYIYVEDGERLLRAIARERSQKKPKYEEMCRRFLADAADFSEEKLMAAGIRDRFENRSLEDTVSQVAAYIGTRMSR